MGYDPSEDPPIRIPIEDILDLHTVSPRDVKPVVEEYLSDGRLVGVPRGPAYSWASRASDPAAVGSAITEAKVAVNAGYRRTTPRARLG